MSATPRACRTRGAISPVSTSGTSVGTTTFDTIRFFRATCGGNRIGFTGVTGARVVSIRESIDRALFAIPTINTTIIIIVTHLARCIGIDSVSTFGLTWVAV